MAKEVPKEEIDEGSSLSKQKSLRMAFILVFIIILVFGSVLLLPRFISQEVSEGEKFQYNGYEIEKKLVTGTSVEGYHVSFYDAKGQLNIVPFHYSPYEVEHFVVDSTLRRTLLKFIDQGTLFISVEPTGDAKFVLAGTEIAKITGDRMLGITTRSALTEPIEGKFDIETIYITNNETGAVQAYNKTLRKSQGIEVRNCNDASDSVFVIQIKQMPRNYVAYSDHCVTLAAQDAEHALMLADALDYRLLGVIANT